MDAEELKAVNDALRPLGKTFEEMFRERYFEIQEIGYEIERKRVSLRYDDQDLDEAQKIHNEIKELEKKKEAMIMGLSAKKEEDVETFGSETKEALRYAAKAVRDFISE